MRFQEAVGGSAVYTDKLADVPVTTPAAEIAAATERGRCGAGAGRREDDGSDDRRDDGGGDRHDGVHRRDDDHLGEGGRRQAALKGAVGCSTSVRVAIAKVGKASKSKAVRAKIAASAWTASATLAKGRYRVTVAGRAKLVTVR